MSSRRKSTTPCMVPTCDTVEPALETNDVVDAFDSEESDFGQDLVPDPYLDLNITEGGYECKYCSFQTPALNLFTLHVDTEHPDVVLNTSYVCMECDYHTKNYDTLLTHNARLHPGEDNFTRTMVRRNNEAVFQQTVNDLTFDGSFIKDEEDEGEEMCRKVIPLSKTPIMRIRSRLEPKKFASALKMSVEDVIKVESDEEVEEEDEPPPLSPAPMNLATIAAVTPRLVPVSTPLQVQAVPQSIVVNSPGVLQVKGGSGGGAAVLPPETLAQVLSALQNQQNQQSSSQTQLLIPISSIPTYNTAMDNNVLLIGAYNRFPYPSVSEITGLSSQTKFSEEQIKVWFSAQRLKHGVSWTPEEVEEARKKKFNGTVQTVPQTITVIPANIATATNGLHSIFQTCQIVGQPGLVLTQVAGNSTAVPVASPVTLTVAGIPGKQPKAAEPSVSEASAEAQASSTCASGSTDAATGTTKPKKSKEQLAELKASYGRRQFATDAEISRLMQVTKLSKRAIKKWFSDTRYNQRNSKEHHNLILGEPLTGRTAGRGSRGGNISESTGGATIVIDSSDDASDASPPSAHTAGSTGPAGHSRAKVRHVFPDFMPQKFKEKTPEQLLALESSFHTSDKPSDEELSRLRTQTKLTRREVDAWFTERRKVQSRDSDAEGDMEKLKPSPPAASERPHAPTLSRRAIKKTPEQLNVLRKAFVRTQWPTPEEYDQISEESGLPRSYIVTWFGDTRYACKNNNLKWYYLYQSGKVDEAFNGGARSPKKSRKRFRGSSRRARRLHPSKRSPQGGASVIKVKSGKEFLKDYYLKYRTLSEKDLDDLVTRSSMSYEQVRDWFTETSRRAEEGKEPFSPAEEDEVEARKEEEGEAEKTANGAGSEEEMEVKEQGEEEIMEEREEEEMEKEERKQKEEEGSTVEEDEVLEEECESGSQSEPPAEEQT